MKIFITGVSGYIGGSIAEFLRDTGHEVSGLVRSSDQAGALRQRGIEAVLGDLVDREALAVGVASSDVVINTAEADDIDLVRPLVAAMAGTGKGLIHTSGSSIVVDDAKGEVAGTAIFDDDQPYSAMPHRLARISVDQFIRTAGITQGIRAAVICPTLVYGQGRGLKADSQQIPALVAKSSQVGAGVFIGTGAPVWSNVHIGDLVRLYALAAEKAPSGAFFFAENGEASFRQTAQAIARSLGLADVQSWALAEALADIGPVAQVALATNCRVRATNARRLLGWAPQGPTLAEALIDEAYSRETV
jgi:nucleoside-diphosphate-sugar epimerase